MGEEAEQGPFPELGGEGTGMDLEQVGEFSRVQSLGGWLVMIAVIRWRRVGSGGPIRVLRWGLRPAANRAVAGCAW